jgi:hypothetical protein
MYCPKCATENTDTGKFCRGCGTDLSGVAGVVSGELKPSSQQTYLDHKGRVQSNNPEDLWTNGVRSAIIGVGFFVVSMALLFTGVAGGRSWWWAMLFPAFISLATGISQIVRANRIEKRTGYATPVRQNQMPLSSSNYNLPPTQTEFVKPQGSIYETGDLVAPPSVTENTTRHLEINKEGETMTLPKK